MKKVWNLILSVISRCESLFNRRKGTPRKPRSPENVGTSMRSHGIKLPANHLKSPPENNNEVARISSTAPNQRRCSTRERYHRCHNINCFRKPVQSTPHYLASTNQYHLLLMLPYELFSAISPNCSSLHYFQQPSPFHPTPFIIKQPPPSNDYK